MANSLPGWKGVDVTTITVEDKSGMGGSREEYFRICQIIFVYKEVCDTIYQTNLTNALPVTGPRTFKVSASGAEPLVVALHSRCIRSELENGDKDKEDGDTDENGAVDKVGERRMEDAALIFSEHGVGPRRLAQGGDWFIDEWVGSTPWHGERSETEKDLHMAAQE